MPSRLLAVALGVLALVVSVPSAANATIICDRFGCRAGAVQSASAGHGRVVSGRPSGCPVRAWCGCWAALKVLGLSPQESKRRELWLARNWVRIGRPTAGPAPGVIAIYARGRRGGHVGVITKVLGRGKVILLSGNDGRAVRERERSTAGVIAYRALYR